MTQPDPGYDENAYTMLVAMLREWNLESLAPQVLQFLQQGYGVDQVPFLLQDTAEYKERFAANEIRKREGLPVLSPRDYLEVERAYRATMRAAGMPEGFWDQHSDFNTLIGADVSPIELQRRVDIASDRVSRITDETADYYLREYGLDFKNLDRGELVAYVLDPTRGMDTINRVMRGGTIAGAAAGRGLKVSREMAERFGAAATEDTYGQASKFAELADRGSFLSSLYEGAYDLETAGEDVFLGDTQAQKERERLEKRERAQFGASSGPSQTALGSPTGAY